MELGGEGSGADPPSRSLGDTTSITKRNVLVDNHLPKNILCQHLLDPEGTLPFLGDQYISMSTLSTQSQQKSSQNYPVNCVRSGSLPSSKLGCKLI